jgi:hypothetical protein
MRLMLAMGVRPTSTHKYRFDRGRVSQIVGKGSLHGLRILQQRQRVYLAAVRDKLLYLWKGVRVLNVDTLHDGLRGGRGI